MSRILYSAGVSCSFRSLSSPDHQQPPPPTPTPPWQIRGVCFYTGQMPDPVRTPTYSSCLLQISSAGKYISSDSEYMLSEESYLLPRAPSADTAGRRFSGKAAGFRSTAGRLAGHVTCVSLRSDQRPFPSFGWG